MMVSCPAAQLWAGQGGSTKWNCRQFAALGHWVALQNTEPSQGGKGGQSTLRAQRESQGEGRTCLLALLLHWQLFESRAGVPGSLSPEAQSQCLLQHLLRAAGCPCLSPAHVEKASGTFLWADAGRCGQRCAVYFFLIYCKIK